MPRAIIVRNTIVPSMERSVFLNKARRSRAHYSGADCKYWLFEDASLPGAYIEFFEAADEETLLSAYRSAPDPVVQAARTFLEVNIV